MTDTEQKRIEAICKVAQVDDIGDLSDGYHTFNQLYYQRMVLFASLVKQNRDMAWKSLRHEDGELCFGGGWFIVGIDTPEGSYTYHYENKYFDLFDCEILDYAKHWDGHTEKDVMRLLSLEQTGQWIPVSERLPDNTDPVSITWVNHDPESYYTNIKDKSFTATGHYCNGRWWWYSVTCQDYLDEYGRCDVEAMDDAIEVIAWMPLPEPYKAESEDVK